MKNKPYVKEINADGILMNPITKKNPFLNVAPSNRGNRKKQYIILTNMITDAYVGKVKTGGNNRKNSLGGRSGRF